MTSIGPQTSRSLKLPPITFTTSAIYPSNSACNQTELDNPFPASMPSSHFVRIYPYQRMLVVVFLSLPITNSRRIYISYSHIRDPTLLNDRFTKCTHCGTAPFALGIFP